MYSLENLSKAIQENPRAFFRRLSTTEDSFKLELLSLIEACTTEHWSTLCDSSILPFVQNACKEPVVMLYGLKVFIACLKLVSYVELEDDERSFPAIEWALHAARPICIAVWDELKFTSPCHDFQLLYLAHQLIHCLILLGISDEYQDLFRDLINSSPIISVSLCVWFATLEDSVRHQANLDRLNLVFRDCTDGCYSRIKEYIDDTDPEVLSRQLAIIIKGGNTDEGSLVECFAFLIYLSEKYPSLNSLGPEQLQANLVLLNKISDSDTVGYDVQLACVYQWNRLLEQLINSRTKKKLLAMIFEKGALLMAKVASTVSTTWSPERHILRRPSLFLEIHQQSPDEALLNRPRLFFLPQIVRILQDDHLSNSPDMAALLSILRTALRPIWYLTLSRLRSVHPSDHPAAPQVTDEWKSLGALLGVHKLVNPLVGCTWVGCSRFMLDTEDDIAVCTRCDSAQYCDERCQKRDWMTHKPFCRPKGSK